MKKNFFEKNSKIVLIAINLVFAWLIFLVLSLDIFQDAPGLEKYSLIDDVSYKIRCQNKRNIVLRENRPNQKSFRYPPYAHGEKYAFNTDENGFVKPSVIHENPDLKIFFLGGSTTECETVEELKRFPYLVGRILEEKTGKKINSYNAARSGNDTIHSLNIFLNKVIPLEPDVVVRMDNINDLSTLLYEASFWNYNKTRSNLGCFSKNTDALRSGRNEWELSPFVNKFSDPKHQEKIKAEYRQILRLFVSMVKAVGAKPVLMTQANRIEHAADFTTNRGDKTFDEVYRKLYAEFHDIVRQVAREENILLIDLAKEIPGEKHYIYDTIHFTNEGSQLVAKTISNQLLSTVKNLKK